MPEPTKEKPIPEKREDAPKDSDKPVPFPGPDVGPGSDSTSKPRRKP